MLSLFFVAVTTLNITDGIHSLWSSVKHPLWARDLGGCMIIPVVEWAKTALLVDSVFYTSHHDPLHPQATPIATIAYFLSLQIVLSSHTTGSIPWNASRSLFPLTPCLPPCSLHLASLFFALPNGLGPVLLLSSFRAMKFTFRRESHLSWCLFTFHEYS